MFHIVAYILKWRSGNQKQYQVSGVLTAEDIGKAKKFWIKFVQQEVHAEMENSVSPSEGGKIHGKFRRLSPYLDKENLWRIGIRLREFVPFTEAKKPPVFLPRKKRLTLLLMRLAHQAKHSGAEETVARFRMMGYWTMEATKWAKLIKSCCVQCKSLDKRPMNQIMGGIPRKQLINWVAWAHVEVDLFGPSICRSDVNKRSNLKVWGIAFFDQCSAVQHIVTCSWIIAL